MKNILFKVFYIVGPYCQTEKSDQPTIGHKTLVMGPQECLDKQIIDQNYFAEIWFKNHRYSEIDLNAIINVINNQYQDNNKTSLSFFREIIVKADALAQGPKSQKQYPSLSDFIIENLLKKSTNKNFGNCHALLNQNLGDQKMMNFYELFINEIYEDSVEQSNAWEQKMIA